MHKNESVLIPDPEARRYFHWSIKAFFWQAKIEPFDHLGLYLKLSDVENRSFP